MRKIFWQLTCLTVLISLLGCGNSLVSTSGKVTFNGTPVEQGEIRFLPTSGSNAPSAAAVITDGQYHVEVAPGSKKVEILGYKVIGQRNIGVMIDIKEQIIPAQYNTQSELTCTVSSSGETHDFNLPQ